MSEQVYNIIQLGRQTAVGTAVAATTLFPVDAGFLGFDLDRASESPDEDFGSSSREQSGRSSTGLRGAAASVPFVARFEDLMHPLEMHAAGTSGTPTGTASPYTYTYTFDETSDSLKAYTLEYGVAGSTQDEWRATGVQANALTLGFDALTAPGNSMWKGSLDLLALDRGNNTLTSSLSAPSTLETMEGHLTTLSEGPVGTAFASLSALTGSLKSFSMTSTINLVRRAYGGSTDVATGYGRSGKATATIDALIKVSSTSKTDFADIYNVSGSVPTERRWRIAVAGSGTKTLTIDFRAVLRAVQIDASDGERLYRVTGDMVKDSTLGGRCQIILKNGVSVIP